MLQRIVERVRARPVRGIGTDGEGARIRVRLDIRGAGHARPVGLRQPADVPRPVRRDPRVRGRRPRAAAAARGRDEARSRRVARALVLGPALPRGHVPRLPADVGPGGAARDPPAAARGGPSGAAARAVRAVHGHRVDLAAVRGRDRLPALAGPAAPRAARRPAGALSRGPDAGRQRRPGQHHDHRSGAGGRVEVPELDLRRDAQHDPRLRARRSRRLRRSDRAPLHPHPERRRHELRRRGSPRCGRSIASHAAPPAPRRPTRGRATAAPWPTAASPPSRRPPWPTRSSAGCSTTTAASRGLRGGRWTWSGDRLTRFRFRGARFTRDVPVYGGATWRLGTGAVRADLRIPGRGRLRARWNVRRPLATATLTGRLGGRRLRATMLAP